MHPLLSIARPGNVFIASASVWLGGWIAGASMLPGIWLDGLAMGLLAAGGNLHNDVIDLKVDRINRPERALPAGKISVSVVNIGTIVLLLTALGIGAFRSPTHLAFFAFVATLLYLYNYWLKGLPVVGNIAVASLCASAVILPMMDSLLWPPNSQPAILIPLAIFSFLFTWTRELVKDIEDMAGDGTAKLRTLPLLIGQDAAILLARVMLVISVLSVVVPSLTQFYPLSFLFIAALFVFPFTLLSFMALSKGNLLLRKAQSMLKIALIGGLVATIVVFRVIPHI